MTASKDRFPWEKHTVSPEAKVLVARAEVQAASERASKRHPMRFRDYMIIGGAVLGLIGIPAILISFFV